ncbi:hypothetical protein HYPSUDRAFT_138815 [Hypholoma sublateritium FD-334 SS-4]|uniref:AAA+ ATPase domain-containing protein n=1 Tax=Hypholoma sublateritium (strain FD-334 SS-4) TaxID=945553 RepID=A0A0D2L6K1_HYPSF|nr:hypothetical protein HYPSUDRAFT_138815 [Hypholoma sublateritium FD-334 SS-4]
MDGGGGVNSAVMNSLRLFILGTIIETGRRFFQWAVERFKLFQYSITAQFQEGDPSYEWIILFLTEEKVWTRARQFRVNATNSMRKWTVNMADPDGDDLSKDENAEYVPTYDEAQLFKWRGYWVEIRRTMTSRFNPSVGNQLSTTLYTRDMSALSALVDDAKARYTRRSNPHVIVHTIDQAGMNFGPNGVWGNSKSKQRRPLSSIILQEGVIQSLVEDAREFIRSEDWYTKAGIPHRRGYLLHGPPGTGKSSTIYAVAGELGLEIYSLSLASSFVDDSFLQRAVASIPKQAIFLIEDIDCAFPSREDQEEAETLPMMAGAPFPPHMMMNSRMMGRQTSPITLSGLLNVLDGVGSEEGKIFFATTNYIDRLDSALLRPGRIDKKIQYKLATKAQAAALFLRFYPESYTTLLCEQSETTPLSEKMPIDGDARKTLTPAEKTAALADLAARFSAEIPEHEFSTAEMQGFLLACKQQPEKAVADVAAWVAGERAEREQKRVREEEREARKREKKELREARQLQGSLARLGEMGAFGGGAEEAHGGSQKARRRHGPPPELDAAGAIPSVHVNGTIPLPNGAGPLSNGTSPMSNGTSPMSTGTSPLLSGSPVQSPNGTPVMEVPSVTSKAVEVGA